VTPYAARLVAATARDRATVVRLDGFRRPQCPRDGTLREERGLWRGSSPRLGPRRDDIEEQATERHPDREWVGQLFTSFILDLGQSDTRKDR
jgi:hypothetical protein